MGAARMALCWQKLHPAGALLWTHTHPAAPHVRTCRYCELNPDKQFANCNIPQELTDEQIDQEAAELAEVRGYCCCVLLAPRASSSHASGVCGGAGVALIKGLCCRTAAMHCTCTDTVARCCLHLSLCALQLSAQAGGSAALTPAPEPEPELEEQPAQSLPKLPAVVQLISENYFSHRKRKEQDEDDIMVCHCPPPWRGGDGCGPNCINRMLCIECTEVRSTHKNSAG